MDDKIGLKRSVVELAMFSDVWLEYGELACQKLKDIFGDDAIAIAHIGSTSINGIAAKPIIDIVVGVKALEVVAEYYQRLETAGFIHVEENDDESQRFFSCGDLENDIRTHHIHVVVYGEKEWNDYLKFRDILNGDAECRIEYEALKRNLCEQYPNDRVAYTEGKADFIQRILKRDIPKPVIDKTVYIPAKTIVTPTKNKYWFGTDLNMNIYRGCSHGCIYCDSRSECYQDDSFNTVKVKKDALSIIANELKNRRKKGVIGTGSMSDPYNPLEGKLELTRLALELVDRYGYGIAIATKSPLVVRDIDILKRIQRHSPVIIKLTITSANDELSKKIEPNVAVSSERFAALQTLADNGIFCGVLLMPVLPYITDSTDNIQAIVEKTASSHANFIYPGLGMTLRDRQRTYYYEKLDELFPGMKEQYKKRFGNQYSCGAPEAKALQAQLTGACETNGLLYKMTDIINSYQKNYKIEQLSLFEEVEG